MGGNDLGNRIKTLRTAKGMTQEELSHRVNVSKAAVSAYENGSRFPSYDVLIRLARLFHTTTDHLLGVTEQQLIEVSGLTPRQQSTVGEIVEAYRAFNQAGQAEDRPKNG